MAKSNKQSTGWRLIPRVQDIGFFQALAVSVTRLGVAAGLTTAGSLGVIYFASDWIRTASGSPMLNAFVIALMLTGLIVSAYLDALFLASVSFPGRWRERVLLGREIEPDDWEKERIYVKEYHAHFFGVMIVLLLSLAWLSQALTNQFLSYYQHVGFALSLMRSDDPDDRFMGVEEMANPLYEEYWGDSDLHTEVANLVTDPDPKVSAKAAYLAGRIGAVDALEPLLEVVREGESPEQRAEAAMALGRLGSDKALSYIATAIRSEEEVEVLGGLRGLALMEDPRGGSTVVSLLERCEGNLRPEALTEEVVGNAFYAMSEMEHHGGAEVALDYLKGEVCQTSLVEKCAAADALRSVARSEHIKGMQAAYELLPLDHECDYMMWRYHEEKNIEVVEGRPLREKVLRAVGNQKDYSTYEWIWNIGANEDEHMETRKAAETYTRALKMRYDQEQRIGR